MKSLILLFSALTLYGQVTINPVIFFPFNRSSSLCCAMPIAPTAYFGYRSSFALKATVSSNYIYLNVTTGDTGKVAGVAIYNDALTTMLCHTAAFSVGTSGWITSGVPWTANCTLPSGPSYWLVITSDSTVAQVEAYSNNNTVTCTPSTSAVFECSYSGWLTQSAGVVSTSTAGITFISNLSAVTWTGAGVNSSEPYVVFSSISF